MQTGRFTRLQEEESLSSRTRAVEEAIYARNDHLDEANRETDRWYSIDVFRDSVIVRMGMQLLQVPYTLAPDGVQFGEPSPVEVEYRPVQIHEEHVMEARLVESAAEADVGLEWDVVIIEPGLSLNGIYYPREVLAESAALFENVSVYFFDDDNTRGGHKPHEAMKEARYLAGWISQVKQREDGALVGRLKFLKEGIARATRTNLVHAWRGGKTDLLGLSIDARGFTKPAVVAGRTVKWLTKMQAALSVDVVTRPAAGGRFTQLVASAIGDHQEDGMSTKTKRLLRVLKSRRPDALAGIDEEKATFSQLAEIANEAEIEEAFTPEEPPAPPPPATPPADTAVQESAVLNRVAVMETRGVVRELLMESKLPPETQKRVRERFEGQVATERQIQEAIDSERAYLATINPAKVRGLGGSREGAGVSVGAERIDRLQAGFDRAFGLEPENPELKGIAPLSLRGLYNEITLGNDPEVSGQLQASAMGEMLQEAFTNATLPQVVANTMNRRLLKDYRELDFGERRIITVTSASDFKERRAIRLGGFGDIPVVTPETGDYAELAAYGEESAPYSVGQRGAIVTVTRKHIINDDVGAVAKLVGRLGRAARRTFAQFVWDFYLTNPLAFDGVAWFAAGHNNLGAAALTVAALNAAEVLMHNQVELSSGKKLGLTPFLLVIPVDLKATAYQINQSRLVPGSANNDANPWFQRFGANNENIIVLPFEADPNNWGLFANPADADIIEVAFLNGQEEPELFLADAPTVGQMFVADKIQHKIRHEYGGAIVDFRPAFKAVVI